MALERIKMIRKIHSIFVDLQSDFSTGGTQEEDIDITSLGIIDFTKCLATTDSNSSVCYGLRLTSNTNLKVAHTSNGTANDNARLTVQIVEHY